MYRLMRWLEDPNHPAGIVFASIGAVLGTILVILFYVIAAPEANVPLYQGFPEWERSATSSEPVVCEPRADTPFDVQSVPPQAPTRIEIVRSMLATELGQIAQWGRLLTVILSVLLAGLVYRIRLVTRYETLGDTKSGAIFREHRKTRRDFFGARIVIALSIGIVTYVLSSLLWIYIGLMFEGVSLPLIGIIPLLAVYCFIVSYIVIRLVAEMRPRDMLIYGLFMFVIGLIGSFGTVADKCWWQESISYVGTDSQADFLFAITLLGVSALFATLLIDLQKLARILAEAGKLGTWEVRLITWIGLGIVFGIAGIAVAPINGAPWVQTIHKISAFGVSILIILAMFLAPRGIPRLYGGTYRWISWTLGALSVLYAILYFGLSWINFVTLELLLFIGFGIWLYVTVQTLMFRVSELEPDTLSEVLPRVYPPRRNRSQGASGAASPGE